jgi:peptidoglycan hydrolase CwlO-like protein
MRYNITVNTTAKNAFFLIFFPQLIAIFFLASTLILVTRDAAHAQTMQCNTAAEKAACQAALNQALADEAAAQAQLASAQGKSATLSQAIALLTAKINAAEADIKAKNILIQTLGSNIADDQSHISDLEGHIAAGKQSLADLLRKTNELDAYSLPEVLLSQSTVTGFFNDVDTFQSVQTGLQSAFDMLQTDEASTSAEKDALTTRQNSEEDARYAIQQQEASVKSDQVEQKQLLSISKGNEKAYTSLVATQALKAAQIRAALFPLAGAKAIPFGDALNYANVVYQKTGVQPSFLLAMLTQETNIGGNVGTCYMTNPSDGSGINTRNNTYVANVMKPSRDVQPFMSIVSALGYDYKTTAVSCPQSIGYGGGMGPAQFIASTWTLLMDRVVAALNLSGPANPWKPMDSFMAAGLYMSDLGAASTQAYSTTAQKNAACKYYSGRACGYVSGATAYANNILQMAYVGTNSNPSIQSQIDLLQ